jgi:hypothetical protein
MLRCFAGRTDMPDIIWEVPLTITSDEGPYTINGPREALHYLENNWPVDCGPLCEAAKVACTAALQPGEEIEESRGAFVRAAIEAENPVLAP